MVSSGRFDGRKLPGAVEHFPPRPVEPNNVVPAFSDGEAVGAVVVAGTEGGAKECFLFRLTVHEGAVYIAPLTAPDKKSKSFNPWIYRMKV